MFGKNRQKQLRTRGPPPITTAKNGKNRHKLNCKLKDDKVEGKRVNNMRKFSKSQFVLDIIYIFHDNMLKSSRLIFMMSKAVKKKTSLTVFIHPGHFLVDGV